MKEKTCCFTGHRHIPEKDYAVIKEGLEKSSWSYIIKVSGFLRPGEPLASTPWPLRACSACGKAARSCA